MEVEYDADLQPSVSEQFGQFHQVIVVYPHDIVILDVWNQALKEGLVRGEESLMVLVSWSTNREYTEKWNRSERGGREIE